MDIVYSPGEDVFLVLTSNHNIILYNTAYTKIKMRFEPPQGGISRLTWIDAVSGEFLAASPKAGILRIYNVAHPTHKEIIKVSRHAIKDLKRMTNDVYLIKLKNG